MAYCIRCGAKLDDTSAFCGECGQPVVRSSTQAASNPVPTFTPPAVSDAPVPTFTPPAASDSPVPTFTPPAASDSPVPTFTPPAASDAPIPTFKPPVPTFTPPRVPMPSGPVCYYHQDEPAVAKCARCGRYLCQDCFDSYGVTNDEYAGQALCYDCTRQLVADNVAELTKNKKKIKSQFIVSLIGIVIGLILGIIAGAGGGFAGVVFGGILGAAIGGVFLSALKAFFSMVWEVIKIAVSGHFGILTIFSILWNIIVLIFKCLFTTISNTIYYIRYLKKTSGFIESDQSALQQMQDYMEYTMVRNQNRGVDIETLLKENSELADNAVAQMARTQTEEQIEANMRNCVATINENGEIIRSFHEAGRAAA